MSVRPSQSYYICTKLYKTILQRKETSDIIICTFIERQILSIDEFENRIYNKGFIESDPLPSRRKTRRNSLLEHITYSRIHSKDFYNIVLLDITE